MVFNNLGGRGPGHLDEPKELRFAHVAVRDATDAAAPVDLAPWTQLGGALEIGSPCGENTMISNIWWLVSNNPYMIVNFGD